MILESFICGPLSTNCYLFGGCAEQAEKRGAENEEIEMVLIDAESGVWGKLKGWKGPNSSSDLSKYPSASVDLKAIIATHGHYDHVRGVREVQEETEADFWIHKDAERTLSDPRNTAKIDNVPEVDSYLEDGDLIEVGAFSLRLIHTPGHSPGGMCLYVVASKAVILNLIQNHTARFLINFRQILNRVQDDGNGDILGVLFSGDLLFKGGVGRTDLPGGNNDELRKSLEKLKELPTSTLVLPGHGPATVLGDELDNLL